MKTKKLLGFIAFVAIIGLAFTTCGEPGEQGAQGEKGDTGTPGALEVWDSSTPSKRLGIYIEGASSGGAVFLSSNDYLVNLNWVTGNPQPSMIVFSEINQLGNPMVNAFGPSNRVFYSFGTFYTYDENQYGDLVYGYSSQINGSTGETSNVTNTTAQCLILRITNRLEIGIPENITPPLVIKAVQ